MSFGLLALYDPMEQRSARQSVTLEVTGSNPVRVAPQRIIDFSFCFISFQRSLEGRLKLALNIAE